MNIASEFLIALPKTCLCKIVCVPTCHVSLVMTYFQSPTPHPPPRRCLPKTNMADDAALARACAKYIHHALPLIKRSLVDANAGVRRNAAFCAGTLAQGGGEPTVSVADVLRCKDVVR